MVAGGGILGDFINSNPLFLGPPNTGYSFAGYKSFSIARANRTPILFVGANDGMLHAFDASYTINSSGMPVVTANSGKEVMGYIPSVVYNNLSKLMSPNYSHRYFVDGTPVGGDICADTCTAAADWKTVVVGTTGAGGQGVFAIDATTGTFNTSSVMWEFTDTDDADLGYTLSKPIIRKLNDGKWYVIFGNGYNNTDADGHSSSAGRAVLYLLRANGPTSASGWTLNTDYFKIELMSPTEPASLATRLTNPNGLSSVSAIDITGDDVSDYLYAGDRNGNLWKIDVTSASTAQWGSSFSLGASPSPLFSAVDVSGNKQQITTGIEVVAHPVSGVLVTFGTGSWIDNQDAIGPFPTTESFYGIWDKMDGTQVVRTDLQRQAVIAHIQLDSSGNAVGVCNAGDADCYAVLSNCTVNYTTNSVASNLNDPLCPINVAHGNAQGQQLGWVTDMPAVGERTRSSMPKVNGSNIKFQTLTPTTDPCTGNTVGMEYQLSAITGGMPSLPVYVTGPGNSGVNTLNNSYFPTLGGATVGVVVSGRTVAGGASDNPIQFNARPPSSVVTPPAGMPPPPTGPCSGSGCSGYIPGWGFLMNLNGATAANSRFIYSCHPPQFGNGAPICTWEYKRGQFGRLNWKQINR
jgi:type IV pilus assembly protein PilY1